MIVRDSEALARKIADLQALAWEAQEIVLGGGEGKNSRAIGMVLRRMHAATYRNTSSGSYWIVDHESLRDILALAQGIKNKALREAIVSRVRSVINSLRAAKKLTPEDVGAGAVGNTKRALEDRYAD